MTVEMRNPTRRKFLKASVATGIAASLHNVLFMPSLAEAQSSSSTNTTAIGSQLTGCMIWPTATPAAITSDTHAVFVKQFNLQSVPSSTLINLFAYSRYRLYVNGIYVGRGPNRFPVSRPEYDTRDVTSAMQVGTNTFTILVHRYGCSANSPISRIMAHDPGFAAVIQMTTGSSTRTIATDTTWLSMIDTSFGSRAYAWCSIPEAVNGQVAFQYGSANPSLNGLGTSVIVTGSQSGNPAFATLWPRTIPLQSEFLIPWTSGAQGSFTLTSGQQSVFTLPQIIQGHHVLSIASASPGSVVYMFYVLPAAPSTSGTNVLASSTYTCAAGGQTWMGGDTFSFNELIVYVQSGSVTFNSVQAYQVRYPFTLAASFNSNDTFLNQLWNICTYSDLVMSEDAFVDCADRERAEWTDCSPPAYDVTSVTMAGPALPGSTTPLYGDYRLLKNSLLRIAQTVQPNGTFKAHSCSDRFDVNAVMVDRCCDWVIQLRRYYDACGDTAFVQQMWPVLTGLLAFFMSSKDANGLIFGREWEVWDNPLRYDYCEGTGLNCFVYRALTDAAYLGNAIGNTSDASAFTSDASALATAVNAVLWDSSAGTYYGANITSSSYQDPGAAGTGLANGGLPSQGLYPPTVQAALFALYSGIVPAARIQSVTNWILNNLGGVQEMMSYYFLFNFYYGLHTDQYDSAVLMDMRTTFAPMVASSWQTSWEFLNTSPGDSFCHCYGMYPAYFLTAYVLGARRVGAVSNPALLIEPRCGGLTSAQGVCVTEFGPIPVSWTNIPNGQFNLNCTIPSGLTATLSLYERQGNQQILIDGAPVAGTLTGGLVQTTLSAGQHTIQYPAAVAGFSLSPASGTIILTPNQGTSEIVTVVPSNGFSGNVTFSVAGLPSGVNYAFSPASSSSWTYFILWVPAGTAGGSFPLTITGTSGSITSSTTITLVINAPVTPSFAITTSTSSYTLAPGAGGAVGVNIVPANGFSGSVTLSASGIPNGVGTTFYPNNPTTGSTYFVMYAPSGTAAGTYPITISGTSGSASAQTPFTLVVS